MSSDRKAKASSTTLLSQSIIGRTLKANKERKEQIAWCRETGTATFSENYSSSLAKSIKRTTRHTNGMENSSHSSGSQSPRFSSEIPSNNENAWSVAIPMPPDRSDHLLLTEEENDYAYDEPLQPQGWHSYHVGGQNRTDRGDPMRKREIKSNQDFTAELKKTLSNDDKREENSKLYEFVRREMIIKVEESFKDQRTTFEDRPTSSLNHLNGAAIDLKSLFKEPASFNEVEVITMDQSTGRQRKLNRKQHKQVAEDATFTEPSIQFPTYEYKWKLSKFLQEGFAESKRILYKSYSSAVADWIQYIPNRLGRSWSVWRAIVSFFMIFFDLLDFFIGMRHMMRKEFGHFEINDAKEKFIKERLEIIDEDRHQYRIKATGKEIDLTLYNNTARREGVYKVLREIVEEIRTRFHNNYASIVDDIIQSKTTVDTSKEQVSKIVTEELQRMSEEDFLKQVQEKLPRAFPDLNVNLVIREYKSSKFNDKLDLEYDKRREEFLNMDKEGEEHPILIQISSWRNKVFDRKLKKWNQKNENSLERDRIQFYRENNFHEQLFVAETVLEFESTVGKSMRDTLEKERIPTTSIGVKIPIWAHKNMRPRKTGSGDYVNWHLEKTDKVMVTTRYPFWRWTLFFVHFWFLFKSLVGLLLHQMYCNVRSLFASEIFFPDITVDPRTGTVIPDVYSKRVPFSHRVGDMVRNIASSRAEFENKANYGLLDRSVQRPFNVIWNYGFKGFGIFVYCIVRPLLTLLNVLVTILLVASSPLWIFFFTFVWKLFNLFIYDSYFPFYEVRWYNSFFPLFELLFVRVFWFTLVQLLSCLAMVVLIHPLHSILWFFFGTLRFLLRRFYDNLCQVTVIKKAKIPRNDTFLCRMIAGPGLASQFYFRTHPDIAILALQARIDSMAMGLYKSKAVSDIMSPGNNVRDWVRNTFGNLGMGIDNSHPLFTAINKRESDLKNELEEKVMMDEREIGVKNKPPAHSEIKLAEQELLITLEGGAKLLEDFMPNLEKWTNKQNQVWIDHSVLPGNYKQLASNLFGEIFGHGFLDPLEEADATFSIEVDHINAKKYLKMVTSASFRDDLEKVTPRFVATKKLIGPESYQINISGFNSIPLLFPKRKNRDSNEDILYGEGYV
eukprot:TRINITY_DN6757_c0_g1_i2.p1 TRINITY_DN6757_c0_g1~~TRINITY_DN6757_c0_g1_i2.p1  ORF type:complete len:1125 (-),score=277.54 TRINITY_DN6757_c0_g1_i2:24-3398(-)